MTCLFHSAALLAMGSVLILATGTRGASATDDEPGRQDICFVSSGDRVSVPVPPRVAAQPGRNDPEPLRLTVYGRTWARLQQRSGRVEFKAPAVRAVTPLIIYASGAPSVPLAEVFIYPKNYRLPWTNGVSVQVAAPSPRWVGQWLQSVGVPHGEYNAVDAPPGHSAAADRPPGVLIVAGSAAGRNAREFDQRYRDAGRNVLLLSASWFGPLEVENSPVNQIVPSDLTGPLGPHSADSWSSAVAFSRRQLAWPGVVNRMTWIEGQSAPVVEELFSGWKQRAVIAGYVPWQMQLGRSEIADRLFVDLLQTVAGYHPQQIVWRHAQLMSPAAGLPRAVRCPILQTALRFGPAESAEAPVQIFDLRGLEGPRFSGSEILHQIQRSAPRSRVLILGSDSDGVIDRGTAGDRKLTKEKHHQLLRIPSDRLPPSPADRVRLMETLTRLRIPLGTISTPGAEP